MAVIIDIMPKKAQARVSPSSGWCFTLNNYTKEEFGSLVQRLSDKSEKFWFCIGKEVGEQGTPHLQGFVKSKIKTHKWRPIPMFSVVRDGVNCGHWTKMKKCMKANLRYCSKDGDVVTNCPEEDPKEDEDTPEYFQTWYETNKKFERKFWSVEKKKRQALWLAKRDAQIAKEVDAEIVIEDWTRRYIMPRVWAKRTSTD